MERKAMQTEISGPEWQVDKLIHSRYDLMYEEVSMKEQDCLLSKANIRAWGKD